MAKTQYFTILLAVASFVDGVASVTDKEFENFSRRLTEMVEDQQVVITQLKEENLVQTQEIERQKVLIEYLLKNEHKRMTGVSTDDKFKTEKKLLQNNTIEERVTILEIQVTLLREDLTTTDENVAGLDEDVNFLFDEQVIQDERLFSLEEETGEIDEQLVVIDDEIENLQDTTFALDLRVTALEENGGSDGNSSVAELEIRVAMLEEAVVGHETRISATESELTDLEVTVADHETRLTAAEENIQSLQMTDVELDARVTALEQNGGGGNSENDTVAFHAVLTTTPNIPDESVVPFDIVLLNEGNGYDNETGTFTVPSGGNGYYYFSVFVVVINGEYGIFDIQMNGEVLCSAVTETTDTCCDPSPASCSAVTYATEGNTVQVVYRQGTDTTPLFEFASYYMHGFNGFRI